VPVVAVLVEALAELAAPGPVGLHHVPVLRAPPPRRGGALLLGGALLAAVGEAAPQRVAAGERRTRHLLTVHLPRRALGGAVWLESSGTTTTTTEIHVSEQRHKDPHHVHMFTR